MSQRVVRELQREVTSALERVGLMCRVFGRFKSEYSIAEKISRKGYSSPGRLMQDLIGIRVTSYFMDDLPIVRTLLARHFREPVDEVRDSPGLSTFQPVRWNLVFRIPDVLLEETNLIVKSRPIDSTFEVQLRSVLAEGWHEVEHDLRYKQPGDWADEPEMSRILNGLLASLENADWSMLQLLNGLAYQKYKSKQWESMMRMKLRIRLAGHLSPDIGVVLDQDGDLAKKLFRVPRTAVISKLIQFNEGLPLNMNNAVLLANRIGARHAELMELEPEPVRALFADVPRSDAEDPLLT